MPGKFNFYECNYGVCQTFNINNFHLAIYGFHALIASLHAGINPLDGVIIMALTNGRCPRPGQLLIMCIMRVYTKYVASYVLVLCFMMYKHAVYI